ncbi:peptidase S8/S53 domain-containing protein [Lactarius quietus]|nr:peptidase S8/S53 domain-containing protein [Lactarius quietus]
MRYPHLLSALFFLAAARPLSDPEPRWDDKRVMHAWEVVPADWESPVTPPAGATIDLSIALKPHDEDALVEALYEVSNPRHPKYGAYLSQEQVAELVAPHPHTLRLPVNSHRVPVSKANDLLSASYQYFLHAETNETIIRTLSYALPEVLHPHVQTIVPTTFFGSGSLRAPLQTPLVHHGEVAGPRAKVESGDPGKLLSSRDTDVTPSLLRSLYNTEAYVPSETRRNFLGTVAPPGLSANQADLSKFMADYRGVTDASYIAFLVHGNYDPNNPSDAFFTWIDYILTGEYLPQTMSSTYRVAEQTVPRDYAISVCNSFAQLALRGVTVLCPSGNYGVGDGDCMGIDELGNPQVKFRPTFPASCPFVTAVGGTTGFTPETETAAPLSGGGFSTIFERRHTKRKAFTNTLRNSVANIKASTSASGGRGLPDVSAQALRYVSITQGLPVYMDGTNCATPTVAGIISLLNDYQLSQGRQPLGFLNPGSAIKWDPVTGLGALDFWKLVPLLPVPVPVPPDD